MPHPCLNAHGGLLHPVGFVSTLLGVVETQAWNTLQPDAEQPVQHEAPEGLPDAEHPEDSALAEQPVTGERDAAEEARTANPPRPPPELPPGIPAPPIPKVSTGQAQGRCKRPAL